jgi:hypothetical protein
MRESEHKLITGLIENSKLIEMVVEVNDSGDLRFLKFTLGGKPRFGKKDAMKMARKEYEDGKAKS